MSRNLVNEVYTTLNTLAGAGKQGKYTIDILAYSDGKHTLLDIAEIMGVSMWQLYEIVTLLKKNGLIEVKLL